MAFESYYWRKDIKKDISYIEKKMKVNVRPLSSEALDEIISQIEIKLFVMAFSIRKLLDTKKLPDWVLDETVTVLRYKRNAKRTRIFFDFFELYDFDHPIKEKLPLRIILNQFIHGFVFQAMSNRLGHVDSVYLNSDYTQRQFLYFLKLKDFLPFIHRISKAEIKEIHTVYDHKKGEYVTTSK